ncbi:hypothetical protein GDO81_028120 [Engystomops pustulosus]|uniref:Apolipoprotein L3 n=1 Tax=Engystomops pustulosus TaxID=76066 RepID=A0AAV6YY73_ENGPU|nr:hypothetical protein GDO81_028120 [Engystomops pustulosus]KAG8541861.1 hypothetical protein GDO81_028120 [Engystomops pustulosus]
MDSEKSNLIPFEPKSSDDDSTIPETGLTTHSILKPKDLELLLKIREYLQDFINTVRFLIETIPGIITDMTTIADDLDKFHRGATIASVTGSTFGIAGGITTIVGLALAPFTLGASLIVSAVGVGVAVAGGVTGAGASIADTVNVRKKCNTVREFVSQINEMIERLKEVSDNINSVLEIIQHWSTGDQFLDVSRLFGRGAFSALEVGRMVQLSKLTTVASRGAQLATRGVQAAAAVSGVLAALFIIIDAIFIVRGAMDLHKGGKSEEAAKIRKCAAELETIHLDLQEVENTFCNDLRIFL